VVVIAVVVVVLGCGGGGGGGGGSGDAAFLLVFQPHIFNHIYTARPFYSLAN
jgi:4-diphosphocytidyl-2C-methyl-D-erythritol kinase